MPFIEIPFEMESRVNTQKTGVRNAKCYLPSNLQSKDHHIIAEFIALLQSEHGVRIIFDHYNVNNHYDDNIGYLMKALKFTLVIPSMKIGWNINTLGSGSIEDKLRPLCKALDIKMPDELEMAIRRSRTAPLVKQQPFYKKNYSTDSSTTTESSATTPPPSETPPPSRGGSKFKKPF
jgi:hypothetical protein